MIEALQRISQLERDAAELDRVLIEKRKRKVQLNISQIERVERSPKHVERLAGLSPDVARKSRTLAMVQWIGATGFETKRESGLIRSFFGEVFKAISESEPRIVADFWTLEESLDRTLSELRHAHVDGRHADERVCLANIKQICEDLLTLNSRSNTALRRAA